MARFLHTADWHLGAPFHGRARARELREARMRTVAEVLTMASRERVDFLLVAGDLFESNNVASSLLYDLKNLFATVSCPVYIIPGNHDPLSQDSIYGVRDEWRELPPHVHVMKANEAVSAPGATIYACPCVAKHATEDPTAWIPRRADDGLRIAVAHGSWQVNPELLKDDYPIGIDAPSKRDLDYLALGHWHSTIPDVTKPGRVFYSGTPETLNFGEEDSGNVLLVEIDGAGTVPVVTKRRIGGYRWMTQVAELHDDASVAALRARLWSIEAPEKTLLRLTLTGAAPAEAHHALKILLDEATRRFFELSADTSGIRLLLLAGDVAELPTALLRRAGERLRQISEGEEEPPAGSVLRRAPALETRAPAELALKLLFDASRRGGEGQR